MFLSFITKKKASVKRTLAVALAIVMLVLLWGAWGSERVLTFAQGARLYFGPASGSYAAGKTFTVSVLLDSGGGTGVNAADGTIAFDPNYLAVSSVTKDGSVFNLWTSDPSFSNSKGTITFSGGNPSAYAGSGGAVMKIVFKALKEGPAGLSFSSASALAADGKGTNVLSGTGTATFTIGGGSAPATVPADAPAPDISAPASAQSSALGGTSSGFTANIKIASPSHPDPTKWYSVKNVQIVWKLPSDIDGVSTVFNKSAGTNPPRASEGAMESKEYDATADGTWYFHIRFKNQDGIWSQTIHRAVLIDAGNPENFAIQVDASDRNSPPKISFKADDTVSGIDHYEIKIDDQAPLSVFDNQLTLGAFVMPALLPGTHKLEAKALDKAGNAATVNQDIQIEGIAAPGIKNAPGQVAENEPVIVEGISDPNSTVTVRLEQLSKPVSEETVKADEDGNWTYVYRKHLAKGDYDFALKMKTKMGVESEFAGKTPLAVTGAPFMESYGIVIIFLLLFVVFGAGAYLMYERKEAMRKFSLVKRETDEMRDKTEAIFAALHEEVDEKILLLDSIQAEKMGVKKLEPGDVADKFKEALDISHDTLAKEIEDIEKALE